MNALLSASDWMHVLRLLSRVLKIDGSSHDAVIRWNAYFEACSPEVRREVFYALNEEERARVGLTEWHLERLEKSALP